MPAPTSDRPKRFARLQPSRARYQAGGCAAAGRAGGSPGDVGQRPVRRLRQGLLGQAGRRQPRGHRGTRRAAGPGPALTSYCPDQYRTPDNVAAYAGLGHEFANRFEQVDILVCSVGTGGHLAAVLSRGRFCQRSRQLLPFEQQGVHRDQEAGPGHGQRGDLGS
ncbi:Pyridoxal-phosphate dependent enzyme [Frankia sp. Hr75.2]|nr:Pyridoxal-phosphate dependent enzyme [Frankia sp. Hr75.2]